MMGRKSASNQQSADLPVDNYRKQIGKEQWKKNKAEVKELKRKAEAKQSALTIKDVILMLGTFLALLLGVYLLFYFYLAPPPKDPS